jgi:MoaA/NifB/PqqE/SkfB family radical SAM enzyme
MIDEFKFLVSPHPAYLIFWVTAACNLSCAHCFNRSGRAALGPDLSLSEIASVSRSMAHVKYLTLAGGEPLLRRDLAAIARIFYRNNDLHMLNLVTNGWHTDRAIIFARQVLSDCPDLHLSVGVSLDGPEEVHDHLRGRAGSYTRAMETLKGLGNLAKTEHRLTVAACGTCHAANIDHLPALAKGVREDLGLPYYVGLIRGDDLPDMALKALAADDYRHLTRRIAMAQNLALASHYPFRHLRIAVDQMVEEIIYNSLKYNKKTVSCKAGRRGFVLRSDGEILLCEVLNTRLGNVRDHTYDPYSILALPASRTAMDRIVKTGCHCTWECFQRLNVVFSPGMYPKLVLRMVRNVWGGNRP